MSLSPENESKSGKLGNGSSVALASVLSVRSSTTPATYTELITCDSSVSCYAYLAQPVDSSCLLMFSSFFGV